jgi:hypothetical protein
MWLCGLVIGTFTSMKPALMSRAASIGLSDTPLFQAEVPVAGLVMEFASALASRVSLR